MYFPQSVQLNVCKAALWNLLYMQRSFFGSAVKKVLDRKVQVWNHKTSTVKWTIDVVPHTSPVFQHRGPQQGLALGHVIEENLKSVVRDDNAASSYFGAHGLVKLILHNVAALSQHSKFFPS